MQINLRVQKTVRPVVLRVHVEGWKARICIPNERNIDNFDRANNDPRYRDGHEMTLRSRVKIQMGRVSRLLGLTPDETRDGRVNESRAYMHTRCYSSPDTRHQYALATNSIP